MNIGGWIIMIVSVGATTGLLVWCLVKVMKEPEAEERLHGQLDVDTGDVTPRKK